MVLVAKKLNGDFFRSQSFSESDNLKIIKTSMTNDAGEELEFSIKTNED